MSQHDRNLERNSARRPARLGSALGLFFAIGLFLVAQAAASYESIGTFHGAPGPVLNQPSGIAVNYTGAGGVPVGTLYSVNKIQHGGEAGGLVLSYDAKGEFRQAWGWGVADENKEFERCGPAGEVAHPTCKGASNTSKESEAAFAGEGAGQLSRPEGIAVDQANGDVYVLNRDRKHGAVQIFTATGEPVGGFGEALPQGGSPSIANGPEKIHDSNFPGRIAVDASGTVYIGDLYTTTGEARTMVFEPETPGDLSTYAYTGQSNDIGSITYTEGAVALDEAGDLYLANGEFISEFPPGEKSTPTCRYKVPGGQLAAMTVNPVSGEIFAISGSNLKFRQLAPCNAQGEFKEKSSFSPLSKTIYGYPLAVDPALSYEPSRPNGILYSGNLVGQYAVEVFAPAVIHFPSVKSQSVSAVTPTSAALHAQINPEGSQTNYVFQYLTQAEYEANNPDEIQSLTVSASGGVFGLSFEGRRYGSSEGTVKLASGSTVATELHTATGTADLKGAVGTADLKTASGKGTVIAGSATVTAFSAEKGSFEVGEQIEGKGIAAGTTIKAMGTGELTLSAPATASEANTALSAGSTALESVSAKEGAFEVGQRIEGKGIPPEATILAVGSGTLTISKAPSESGTAVAIEAYSKVLTSVATGEGHFEVGQSIEFEGDLEGTGEPIQRSIASVEGKTLTLSSPVKAIATGATFFSLSPYPFEIGQRIEGVGIPPETTILGAREGELTLSNPASASGTANIQAGVPFDASAGEVRQGLEVLPGIGAGNVAVSGGPGDEAGSNPYRIHFGGELTNTDLPLVEADGSGLSGGPASVTVQGEHDGGGGFAGAAELPPGGAVLGTGQETLSATAGLVGLQPDTSYRYRVVASSPCNPNEEEVPCEAFGKAGSFRTFPSQAPELPDRRAYELVSPAEKAGGEVFRLNPWISSCSECNQEATAFPKQSSPDGEALVYEAGPFANSGTGLNANEYVARRTSSGWQSTNLTPERIKTLGSYETGFKAFDTNFSRGLLAQVNPSLTADAPSEYANLYGFSTADPGALSPLIGAEPPHRSPGAVPNGLRLVYAGATPDLTHSLFEANDALTGETPSAPEAVDGGVNKYNLYESVEGELRLVNVLPGNTETVPGATFGSGLALNKFYTGNEYDFDHAISTDGSRIFWSDASGQVYLREDGERTRELSDHTGKFLTATPDGSEVLLSDGHLIGIGDEEPVTDLTEGKGGFQGIAGNSEDLSSVYFVDTAVLNGGENERGERPRLGQSNLYLFRGGTVTFIAALEGKLDNEETHSLFGGDWRAAAGHRSAEASPGGRYLAFLSHARLTGVDNTGLCGFNSTGSKRVTFSCPEVFLYDSQTGHLSCPSCNPNGRSPLGESTLPINDPISSNFQAQPRYLTDSGRLYFNSGDSLSTFDTNEGVEDLYQYEPEGVGTCTHPGGCINLISAGGESVDSNFYSMSNGGRDVFFVTRDQLALKDKDDLLDIYDARENGGIASETETSRGECQGEACQPLANTPNDPTPGSSTFEGAGNVNEAKVAKKHKKKRHAKKHSKKRAAKHNRGGAK